MPDSQVAMATALESCDDGPPAQFQSMATWLAVSWPDGSEQPLPPPELPPDPELPTAPSFWTPLGVTVPATDTPLSPSPPPSLSPVLAAVVAGTATGALPPNDPCAASTSFRRSPGVIRFGSGPMAFSLEAYSRGHLLPPPKNCWARPHRVSPERTM